jgi:hypothetical protein
LNLEGAAVLAGDLGLGDLGRVEPGHVDQDLGEVGRAGGHLGLSVRVTTAVAHGARGGLVGGEQVGQQVGGDGVRVGGRAANDLVGLAGQIVNVLLRHPPLGGEAACAQALPLEAHLEADDDGDPLVNEGDGLPVACALGLGFIRVRHGCVRQRIHDPLPLPAGAGAGVRASAPSLTYAPTGIGQPDAV